MQSILKSVLNCRQCCLRRFSISVYQQSSCKGKIVEEYLQLPAKPKRPLTSFLQYLVHVRPVVMEKYPDANKFDLMKIIAEQWKNVDESTKKKLKEDFQANWASYQIEFSKYEKQLTPEQREFLKEERQNISEIKKKKKLRRKKKRLGKPKKPLSPYFLFMKDKLVTRDPNLRIQDWHKVISAEWKNLSAEERQRYSDDVRKYWERYEENLSEWEGKMLQQRDVDIVRKKSLIEPPHQRSGQDKSSNKSHTHNSLPDVKQLHDSDNTK